MNSSTCERTGPTAERSTNQDLVADERLSEESAVRRWLTRDRDVHRMGQYALEHLLTVAHRKRQLDPGVLLRERPHQRRNERLRRRRDRRDMEPARGQAGGLAG